MILVLLGTQDKPFTRLLDAIEKQIESGDIKEEVIVQAGCTKYESKNMKIFDLIPNDEFLELITKAKIVIAHGGVGSIVDALKRGKKVIAAARLKEYGEHVNDHQEQIIDRFVEMKYVLKLQDFNKLNEVLKECKRTKFKKYKSTTNKIIELIDDYIESI
jgi:UDP-N-acetylglucosamine transferase subunit ALG13